MTACSQSGEVIGFQRIVFTDLEATTILNPRASSDSYTCLRELIAHSVPSGSSIRACFLSLLYSADLIGLLRFLGGDYAIFLS